MLIRVLFIIFFGLEGHFCPSFQTVTRWGKFSGHFTLPVIDTSFPDVEDSMSERIIILSSLIFTSP